MKILLATDGSESSAAAIHLVATQIRADADVLVLEVVEAREPEFGATPKEHFDRARQSVEAAAKTLAAAGLRATTRVIESEPRDAILDTATEWGADFIVLGSHGRKGLRRFLLGSVAESVVRNAHCSVLVVRT